MTGKTRFGTIDPDIQVAAMEPGRGDREDAQLGPQRLTACLPLWSPVAVTGKTRSGTAPATPATPPLWSPVAVTGKTALFVDADGAFIFAAMEPGHGDREDPASSKSDAKVSRPLWSPVAVTGKTRGTTSEPSGPPRPGRYGARSR